MDYMKIGNFIKNQRKKLNLTQKALAERLNITPQAVSKWELGETLPDTALLLDLSNILHVSVDRLLTGGNIITTERKLLRMQDVVDGFNSIVNVGKCFGEKNTFYTGMLEGINTKMNMDIDLIESLKDPKMKDMLYTEVILQAIINGYYVDIDEVKLYIKSPRMINYVIDYLNKIA